MGADARERFIPGDVAERETDITVKYSVDSNGEYVPGTSQLVSPSGSLIAVGHVSGESIAVQVFLYEEDSAPLDEAGIIMASWLRAQQFFFPGVSIPKPAKLIELETANEEALRGRALLEQARIECSRRLLDGQGHTGVSSIGGVVTTNTLAESSPTQVA